MKKLILGLSVILFTATIIHAQKPEVVTEKSAGWHKIGESKVNFKTEKDKFVVLGADRFKAIQIKVKDSPVHIDDMEVTYEGGLRETVSIRSDLAAGSTSAPFNLKNNSAEIRNVSFVYKTVENNTTQKATIELWGLK